MTDPDAIFVEQAYLVARGVRALALVDEPEPGASGLVRAKLLSRLRMRAAPGAIAFLLTLPDGKHSAGYASHRWVIDLLEWTLTEAPARVRDRLIGLMLGYSSEAIQRFEDEVWGPRDLVETLDPEDLAPEAAAPPVLAPAGAPRAASPAEIAARLYASQARVVELENELRDLRRLAVAHGDKLKQRGTEPRMLVDHAFAPAELSVRALNVLHNYAVKTVDDLLALDLEGGAVRRWRNSGPKLRLQLRDAQALHRGLRRDAAAPSVVASPGVEPG